MKNTQFTELSKIEKLIPDFANVFMNALYSEITSPKNKPRTIVLVSTKFAIFILNESGIFGKSYSVENILPIHELKLVEVCDQTLIICHNENNVFSILDPTIIAKDICKLVLLYNLHNSSPMNINFVGFDTNCALDNFQSSLYRYDLLNYCDNAIGDSSIRKLFEKIDISLSSSLYLDSSIQVCNDLVNFANQVSILNNVSMIALNGYAPHISSIFLKYLIKHSSTIRCVKLENYSDYAYELLKINRIHAPKVNSWIFSNCFSNLNRLFGFLNEMKNYKNPIQRLCIDKQSINLKKTKDIGKVLLSGYCFQYLEILEICNINAPPEEIIDIFYVFVQIASKLQYIYRLAIKKSLNILRFQTKFLIPQSSSLTQLILSNIDISTVTEFPDFPENLSLLSISNSIFSSTSLLGLHRAISKLKLMYSLDLSKMQIHQDELVNFFTESHDITPLSTIIELNWSYNIITSTYINDFIHLYLSNNCLRYLGIAYCFSIDSISALEPISNHFKSAGLWGLQFSLGEKLSENIGLFEKIISDPNIHSLELYGNCGDIQIAEMIVRHPNIKEITIESSSFTSFEKLLSFYDILLSKPSLVSSMVPMEDILKLNPKNNPQILGLFEKMRRFIVPSTKEIRCDYYRMNGDNMKSFFSFLTHYPISIREFSSFDNILSHNYGNKSHEFSFNNFPNIEEQRDFTIGQCQKLSSVCSPPIYSPEIKFDLPEWMTVLRRNNNKEPIRNDVHNNTINSLDTLYDTSITPNVPNKSTQIKLPDFPYNSKGKVPPVIIKGPNNDNEMVSIIPEISPQIINHQTADNECQLEKVISTGNNNFDNCTLESNDMLIQDENGLQECVYPNEPNSSCGFDDNISNNNSICLNLSNATDKTNSKTIIASDIDIDHSVEVVMESDVCRTNEQCFVLEKNDNIILPDIINYNNKNYVHNNIENTSIESNIKDEDDSVERIPMNELLSLQQSEIQKSGNDIEINEERQDLKDQNFIGIEINDEYTSQQIDLIASNSDYSCVLHGAEQNDSIVVELNEPLAESTEIVNQNAEENVESECESYNESDPINVIDEGISNNIIENRFSGENSDAFNQIESSDSYDLNDDTHIETDISPKKAICALFSPKPRFSGFVLSHTLSEDSDDEKYPVSMIHGESIVIKQRDSFKKEKYSVYQTHKNKKEINWNEKDNKNYNKNETLYSDESSNDNQIHLPPEISISKKTLKKSNEKLAVSVLSSQFRSLIGKSFHINNFAADPSGVIIENFHSKINISGPKAFPI